MNMNLLQPCKELVVSQINGLEYPSSNEEEDKLLRNHFQTEQTVEEYQEIVLFHPIQRSFHSYITLAVQEYSPYVYVVHKITDIKGSTLKTGLTSAETKVILQHTRSMGFEMKAFHNRISEGIRKSIDAIRKLPPCKILLPLPSASQFSNPQNVFPLQINDSTQLEYETKMERGSQLSEFQHLWNTFSESNSNVREICRTLRSIFSFEKSFSPNIIFQNKCQLAEEGSLLSHLLLLFFLR
jgi:hypothetical protein